MAFRPLASAPSMISRYGSQALADGLRLGRGSVSGGQFSAPGSVDTSMAGFGCCLPHPPGRRTGIPAAFR
jgi:hypothetical protein